jgi:hypothetical protein
MLYDVAITASEDKPLRVSIKEEVTVLIKRSSRVTHSGCRSKQVINVVGAKSNT